MAYYDDSAASNGDGGSLNEEPFFQELGCWDFQDSPPYENLETQFFQQCDDADWKSAGLQQPTPVEAFPANGLPVESNIQQQRRPQGDQQQHQHQPQPRSQSQSQSQPQYQLQQAQQQHLQPPQQQARQQRRQSEEQRQHQHQPQARTQPQLQLPLQPQHQHPSHLTLSGNASYMPAVAGPMAMPSGLQAPLGLASPPLDKMTEAQRQKLQSIAMPAHALYQSPRSDGSPIELADAPHKSPSISSPEGAHSLSSKSPKSESRKRKLSGSDDEDDDDEQPVKKTAHNMIEKRYRTNLNDKIAALRDSVPSLRIMSKSSRGEDITCDRAELQGLAPAHKLNKATILSKATEYIRHLEKRNSRLIDENQTMQARITAFEKLFMAGAMHGTVNGNHGGPSPVQQQPSPTPVSFNTETYSQESNGFVGPPMATPNHADVQGMIQVPDEMKRLLASQMAANQPYPMSQQAFRPNPSMVRQQRIQQQRIQQQQQQVQPGGWQNVPYGAKVLVGSLAGLMLVEAFHENDQSNETPDGRGLSMLPNIQMLKQLMPSPSLHFMGYHVQAADMLMLLKLTLLLSSLLWVFLPSFSPHKPESPKKVRTSLQAMPSLATPLHVRQQAWLTAIQTVWVPRHNFFLEAAALGLKAFKLSIRNLIGVHGFQLLTGLTEDQEIARVKAWTIALDAQLAGGDTEISKSRLTLTLLASETLSDTPYRLMLKALHIQILLWEVGLTGARLGVFKTIANKLSRSKWNEAKQLHEILKKLRRGQGQSDDDLPDHLAVLLQQDADDVFSPTIIQRAQNLAWNRSSGSNAIGVTDGMDAVVEDAAVRSSMDAVAAWWSTLTLQTALADSLSIRQDEGDRERKRTVDENITLAIRTAPIGSTAQNRALVARAVLSNEKHGVNIAAVIQALGSNVSGNTDEIHMCLQCAKAMAHLQRYAPPEEPVAVYSIINEEIHATNEMSLLGYTAAFSLMERLAAHDCAAKACKTALESLSGSLRIWTGKDRSLDQEIRLGMAERCLAVTRDATGMNYESDDTGYGSLSTQSDDDFDPEDSAEVKSGSVNEADSDDSYQFSISDDAESDTSFSESVNCVSESAT